MMLSAENDDDMFVVFVFNLHIIGVARLAPDPQLHAKDIEKIQHRFANVKLQYESIVYDSRCLVLCKTKPDITLQRNFIFIEDEVDDESNFSGFINEYISTLFVVLESKRVEKCNEKLDKMDLPTSPIEQEQVFNDSDTRCATLIFLFIFRENLSFCNFSEEQKLNRNLDYHIELFSASLQRSTFL